MLVDRSWQFVWTAGAGNIKLISIISEASYWGYFIRAELKKNTEVHMTKNWKNNNKEQFSSYLAFISKKLVVV